MPLPESVSSDELVLELVLLGVRWLIVEIPTVWDAGGQVGMWCSTFAMMATFGVSV